MVTRTVVSPRYALALGLDLVSLAAEPLLGAEKDPAGDGARAVDPAGVRVCSPARQA